MTQAMVHKKWGAILWALLTGAVCFAQNVGIGTTSPTDKLTVQTAPNSSGITHTDGTRRLTTFLGGSTNGAWLGTVSNHPLSFFTDNRDARLTIGTNGSVGIGTSNPVFVLDVGNRMRVRSQATGGVTAGIWFNNYTNTAEEGFMGEVGPGAPNHIGMYGSTSGWSLVMNTLSGNVGINTFNTTAGNGKLNISSGGNAIKLLGGGQYISFYDVANNYKGYVWNPGNNIEIGTDGSNANGEVNLKTKGVQGLSVMSDGRIRVGTLACVIPVGFRGVLPKLSIFGSLGFKKQYDDQVGEWAIGYDDLFDRFIFSFNGGGKAFISDVDGSWNTFSDARLKENHQQYKAVLDDLKKLQVLTYHYKNTMVGKRSFGLIAQNVQSYFPEIVSSTGSEDLLGIDYAKTGVLAIKAIQEQQQMIEQLQRQIRQLEKRLAQLEKR
jgi:hypothetical protein